jgi:hypothetical protein
VAGVEGIMMLVLHSVSSRLVRIIATGHTLSASANLHYLDVNLTYKAAFLPPHPLLEAFIVQGMVAR